MTLSPISPKSISTLRELLNSDKHYKWTETHQKVFNNVLDDFKKETFLSYFNISKHTFIFTAAHQSGLSQRKFKTSRQRQFKASSLHVKMCK